MASTHRCVWDVGWGSFYIPCGKLAWTERVEGRWIDKEWKRVRVTVGSYHLTGPWAGPRCDEHQWAGVAERVHV